MSAPRVISMGESWHNGHHAFPRSARHGVLRNQWDSSAQLISAFERAGWANNVHWPTPEALHRFTAKEHGGPYGDLPAQHAARHRHGADRLITALTTRPHPGTWVCRWFRPHLGTTRNFRAARAWRLR